ncbi:MAG: OB-fold nucleic acid binding domain-containing protein [Bacillota bacterium]|nr:OB-fold nucleic acid binding domain-containing protein [Bacillota bacterium]
MDNVRIKDFKVSDNITSIYLLSGFNVKTSSSNKLYLDLTLQDKSGEINAKLWNIKNNEHEEFKAGDVVKVKGTVTSFKESLQFKIGKIRLATKDEYSINELVIAAPIDPLETFEEIMGLVDEFESQDIKVITKVILEKYKEPLLVYPAAKSNHHSIKSGLLYHIKRMLEVGKALATIYNTVDKDLLYAGIILHDIEKINEMDANELGIVSDYTRDGKMLGHLIMGVKTISEVAQENNVDEEISVLLQHMMLSHHYEPEFGSPVRPMFLEAELLHHIDLIDARVYDFDDINDSLENGSFSNPIWTLDKRRIYRSNYKNEK